MNIQTIACMLGFALVVLKSVAIAQSSLNPDRPWDLDRIAQTSQQGEPSH